MIDERRRGRGKRKREEGVWSAYNISLGIWKTGGTYGLRSP